MSHRKFEHPRHGSLGFLPRKRASRHRGKGIDSFSHSQHTRVKFLVHSGHSSGIFLSNNPIELLEFLNLCSEGFSKG